MDSDVRLKQLEKLSSESAEFRGALCRGAVFGLPLDSITEMAFQGMVESLEKRSNPNTVVPDPFVGPYLRRSWQNQPDLSARLNFLARLSHYHSQYTSLESYGSQSTTCC